MLTRLRSALRSEADHHPKRQEVLRAVLKKEQSINCLDIKGPGNRNEHGLIDENRFGFDCAPVIECVARWAQCDEVRRIVTPILRDSVDMVHVEREVVAAIWDCAPVSRLGKHDQSSLLG